MRDDADEAVSERRICPECIGEPFLKQKIAEEAATERPCSYCGRSGPTVSVGDLADGIEGAIERHFHRTSDEPGLADSLLGTEGSWVRPGYPVANVIADMAGLDEGPSRDVQVILNGRHPDAIDCSNEPPYGADARYEEASADDVGWQAEWNDFETALKTENRFFNKRAEATLESIFKDLATLQTCNARKAVVDAGPGTDYQWLFRARAFQKRERLTEALKYPDREVGTPPSLSAAAGRMNASGISMFYGSKEPHVALAEIRPPVGSDVVVGRFEIIRTLRLLDLNAMLAIDVDGSYFDPEYMNSLERAQFLRRLSRRMSMPVMPDDERFEYLITQAIADYLATQVSPPLNGIIYPSVQAGSGENIVLFHGAARVERLNTLKGAKLSVRPFHRTEERDEPDYWVTEEVPPMAPEPKASTPTVFDPNVFLQSSFETPFEPYDGREISLRLDVGSLHVHHVNQVSFETRALPVRRDRIVGCKPLPQGYPPASDADLDAV
jgi:hypothetical protein